MAARRGFVTAGTWCVDHNKLIAAWPAEDTASEVLAIDRQGGGSACNLAIDMKRLDPAVRVETIGLIGDDENGRFLAAQCDAHGIGRGQMRVVAGEATFSVDAFTVANGKRTHLFYPGVAKRLSPDDFDFSKTPARILHLGLPGAHRIMDAPWRAEANGWVAALKAARGSGLQTNLELMTIAPERLIALARPCLPHLDYLIVNDFEIGAATGVETRAEGRTDVAAVRRAIEAALRSGPMRVVAAHFPEGALAGAREGGLVALGSLAMPKEEVVGANGAGDAFAAGLLYGLHQGWDLRGALALGHCAAAASMRAISTTAGVGSWRECLALGERWGFRDAPE
ncbi:MAG TPA: carbohydrate kinase family protein [Roseiarcus sp.]|nr:carbohydrate kinase family protein [Roseiarcus sp.]